MNKLSAIAYPAIAILSLAAAFAAHAESPTVDDAATQVWSSTYNPLALAKSLKSRDGVRAEALAARASGESEALIAEDSGSFQFAQRLQARDASQVLAGRHAATVR